MARSFVTEMETILKGLQLAVHLRATQVILEFDSVKVVSTVNSDFLSYPWNIRHRFLNVKL